jgi:hypothetical protein
MSRMIGILSLGVVAVLAQAGDHLVTTGGATPEDEARRAKEREEHSALIEKSAREVEERTAKELSSLDKQRAKAYKVAEENRRKMYKEKQEDLEKTLKEISKESREEAELVKKGHEAK